VGISSVQDGNKGYWYSDDASWVTGHEAGHIFGLGDKYEEKNGVPYPGWEFNVMAEFGGVVEQRNINEIVESLLSPQDRRRCKCQ
jgi:hypothetical protein